MNEIVGSINIKFYIEEKKQGMAWLMNHDVQFLFFLFS